MDRVVTHNGTPQRPEDYEAGKMRLGTMVRCADCPGFVEPERLRWAERKGIKVTTCDSCAFARRAARSQSTR